jgi:hypothetical protein
MAKENMAKFANERSKFPFVHAFVRNSGRKVGPIPEKVIT